MNKKQVGKGKVVLISGGGKCYTDIAAKFCRSREELDSIISSEYNKNIVDSILTSGHLAATEFDYYLFGIEGYSRVTEAQLIRKRLASYMISSGRNETEGKRDFDVVMPESLDNLVVKKEIALDNIFIGNKMLCELYPALTGKTGYIPMVCDDILLDLEYFYNEGVKQNLKEEDLRYMKPQATEFKAIVGMNAHSLIDWFRIRCCKRAQTEIRDMANKMLCLCKESNPDLFKYAGPSCIELGYCPENNEQDASCKDKIITKNRAKELLYKEMTK